MIFGKVNNNQTVDGWRSFKAFSVAECQLVLHSDLWGTCIHLIFVLILEVDTIVYIL